MSIVDVETSSEPVPHLLGHAARLRIKGRGSSSEETSYLIEQDKTRYTQRSLDFSCDINISYNLKMQVLG
jgi:hypothetical protein